MVGIQDFDLRGAQGDNVSNFVDDGSAFVKADLGKAVGLVAYVSGTISKGLVSFVAEGVQIYGKLISLNPLKNDYNTGANVSVYDPAAGKYDDATVQNKGFMEFTYDTTVPVVGQGVIAGATAGNVKGSGGVAQGSIVHKVDTSNTTCVVELR